MRLVATAERLGEDSWQCRAEKGSEYEGVECAKEGRRKDGQFVGVKDVAVLGGGGGFRDGDKLRSLRRRIESDRVRLASSFLLSAIPKEERER